MIVTGIILAAFVILLAQALIETVWGVALIAYGLCLHGVAWILDTLANGVAILIKIARNFQKAEAQPPPKRVNVVSAFLKYQGIK